MALVEPRRDRESGKSSSKKKKKKRVISLLLKLQKWLSNGQASSSSSKAVCISDDACLEALFSSHSLLSAFLP